MSTARLYVEGESWEIMGNVTDSFLSYENTLEASRSGKVYGSTEAKVKTVSVDEIKVNLDEFEEIVAFFDSCKASTNYFSVTVAIGEDCDDGFFEYVYTNCLVQGSPEFSLFEKKIENFEFGYESRTVKTS